MTDASFTRHGACTLASSEVATVEWYCQASDFPAQDGREVVADAVSTVFSESGADVFRLDGDLIFALALVGPLRRSDGNLSVLSSIQFGGANREEMQVDESVRLEAEAILKVVTGLLPARVDAVAATLAMKSGRSSNWRQMEWPGFWFEHVARPVLDEAIKGGDGPAFGRTRFDFKATHVWDLKVHMRSKASGQPNPWMILNDQEAVLACLEKYGGLGFVTVEADAEFDVDGSFKRWHDMQKGRKSAYVKENEARGAAKRVRKAAVTPREVVIYWFDDVGGLEGGQASGWLKGFQEGMRNSNGTPRRAKFQIRSDAVPDKFVAARATLSSVKT